MNFRSKNNRARSGINMTPLLDMVFILLIFFAVSTAFINKTSFDINLSEALNGDEITKNKLVTIGVTSDNVIFYEGEPIYGNLLEILQDAKKDFPDASFAVEADENSAHGVVIEVIDTGKAAGFDKFSIITVEKYN